MRAHGTAGDRSSSVRLPTFLVIGAMKAGSTTLYEDLRASDPLYVPMKELRNLNDDSVLESRGRRRYAALFAGARADQLVGEVSAWYSMLPDWPGVADRAAALLGDNFRVIYIVRNPVDRIVSHHHHDLARGVTDILDIDRAVKEVPRLLNYSRYHYQIAPWIDVVGAGNVRLVKFEDYVADRQGGLRSLLGFLGAPLDGGLPTGLDSVHNASDTTMVAHGLTHRVLDTQLYRRVLHRWVPEKARHAARSVFLSSAPARPRPPSESTVDAIIQKLAPDLARLQTSGLDLPDLWNFDHTRERYARMRHESAAGT